MNFNFPEKFFFNGYIIKENREVTKNRKTVSFDQEIDITKPSKNVININNIEYYFTYLDNLKPKNKGGNSIILRLYQADSFDTDDINYEIPDRILKILKSPINKNYPKANHKRFEKEIEALLKCKQASVPSIVEIFEHGECVLNISSGKKRISKTFYYYTMEPAEGDLTDFLKENQGLDETSRISLCYGLAKALQSLYSLGYYHRDLKPDNILIFGDEWKIADLGLIDHRDLNFKIDRESELIGPRGWLSPEALNKKLCEIPISRFEHDYEIDHQSDLFQLGKIFCYILQGNNPMGVINLKDLQIVNHELKQVVLKMLYYKKSKRLKNIQSVINRIKPIEANLVLNA